MHPTCHCSSPPAQRCPMQMHRADAHQDNVRTGSRLRCSGGQMRFTLHADRGVAGLENTSALGEGPERALLEVHLAAGGHAGEGRPLLQAAVECQLRKVRSVKTQVVYR